MPGILVVAPNWIGDALMAQPLFARLHERLPNLRLDVLAPDWVAPVLRRMPEVHEVVVGPFRHGSLQLRERWRLGRALRERRYDHAIVLPNSWKSALVPYFAGIALRSGYVGEQRYGLLNLLYRPERGATREAMTERYARLSDAPGKAAPATLPSAQLRVDRERAAATVQRFGFDASGPLALLCPGAEYGPAKRWPAERFAALAATLSKQGYQVALLGSANDAPVCAEVAQASASARSLAGQTSLDEAIEIIALAQLVVTNDSGLMHIAAALERPQIAIFGSSSPAHTPPRSDKARVIWLGVECSPCFQPVCPLGHFRCMREISVERVLSEAPGLAILAPAQSS